MILQLTNLVLPLFFGLTLLIYVTFPVDGLPYRPPSTSRVPITLFNQQQQQSLSTLSGQQQQRRATSHHQEVISASGHVGITDNSASHGSPGSQTTNNQTQKKHLNPKKSVKSEFHLNSSVSSPSSSGRSGEFKLFEIEFEELDTYDETTSRLELDDDAVIELAGEIDDDELPNESSDEDEDFLDDELEVEDEIDAIDDEAIQDDETVDDLVTTQDGNLKNSEDGKTRVAWNLSSDLGVWSKSYLEKNEGRRDKVIRFPLTSPKTPRNGTRHEKGCSMRTSGSRSYSKYQRRYDDESD